MNRIESFFLRHPYAVLVILAGLLFAVSCIAPNEDRAADEATAARVAALAREEADSAAVPPEISEAELADAITQVHLSMPVWRAQNDGQSVRPARPPRGGVHH